MNMNPKWIRVTLDTPKVIRFAKRIWTEIHCESWSNDRIAPKYTAGHRRDWTTSNLGVGLDLGEYLLSLWTDTDHSTVVEKVVVLVRRQILGTFLLTCLSSHGRTLQHGNNTHFVAQFDTLQFIIISINNNLLLRIFQWPICFVSVLWGNRLGIRSTKNLCHLST